MPAPGHILFYSVATPIRLTPSPSGGECSLLRRSPRLPHARAKICVEYVKAAMRTEKLNLPKNLAFEIEEKESDAGKIYRICGMCHGNRIWNEGSFSTIEDAIVAGFGWLLQIGEEELVRELRFRIHLILLVIYLEIKPGDPNEKDYYGSIWGPMGDYLPLDILKLLGYLENVSKRNRRVTSRWAEIILTYKGAEMAQQIENLWETQRNSLPILAAEQLD